MPNQRYTPGYTPSLDRRAVAGAYVNPYDDLLSAIEKGAEKVAGNAAQDLAQDRVFSGQQPGLTLGLTDVQRAYNRAAEGAYAAKTEADVRSKVAALAAKYDGRSPDHPKLFAQEFDAFSDAIKGSVPESMKAQIGVELDSRRALAVAGITDTANRYEYQRNVSALAEGLDLDWQDAASAEQIGRTDLADAAKAKAEDKLGELVAVGAISLEGAENRRREGREQIAVESLFRGFMTGAVSAEAVATGKIGTELSARARDRLVNKIEGELNRRHSASVRAEAAEERAMKHTREVFQAELAKRVWSPNEAERPTPDQIVDAVRVGLLSGDDAESFIRSQATTKEARTDIPTLSRIDDQISLGVDTRDQITQAVTDGTLHPDDAAPLYDRNRAALARQLPDEIETLRDDAANLFRESGLGAEILKEGEEQRRTDARQFLDQQVRAAPEGVDPKTGLSFRVLAARQAYAILQQRREEEVTKKLRLLPPREAATVPPPPDNPLGAPRLNVKETSRRLRGLHAFGQLTDDELDLELAIIDRWKAAGLVAE
jgi:hypothetical protein